MSRASLMVLLALAACEVVPPSGDMLQPVPVAGPSAGATAVDREPAGPDEFDFDAYKQEQAQVDGVSDLDAADELLAELGAEGSAGERGVDKERERAEPAQAEPPAAPEPVAPAAPAAAPGPQIQAVDVALGVRLVATLPGTVPPRAVLGLPDGQERVVQAGDMVPEARVVVLAVGRDLVQIAQIHPKGDHAGIQPVFLQSLFPGGRLQER